MGGTDVHRCLSLVADSLLLQTLLRHYAYFSHLRFHSEFVLHKTKYAHMCTSVANSGLEFKPRPLLQQHCNLTSVPAFQCCSAPMGAQEKAQTVLSHYFWHWRWTNKLKLFWMQILHPTVCGTPWFSDTLSIPPSHNGTQILLSWCLYWAPTLPPCTAQSAITTWTRPHHPTHDQHMEQTLANIVMTKRIFWQSG